MSYEENIAGWRPPSKAASRRYGRGSKRRADTVTKNKHIVAPTLLLLDAPSMYWQHPCTGSVHACLSRHRRRPSTSETKQNQSESQKIRPDATNIEWTTGTKTAPLPLVSMIADDVYPWLLWCLSRRVRLQSVRAMTPCKTSSFNFDFARRSTKTRGSIAAMTAQLSTPFQRK